MSDLGYSLEEHINKLAEHKLLYLGKRAQAATTQQYDQRRTVVKRDSEESKKPLRSARGSHESGAKPALRVPGVREERSRVIGSQGVSPPPKQRPTSSHHLLKGRGAEVTPSKARVGKRVEKAMPSSAAGRRKAAGESPAKP